MEYVSLLGNNRGFYSSSDTEDNDSESNDDSESRLKLMLKGSLPRYTVTACSINRIAYCVVSFDDPNLVNPIPDLEAYRPMSLALKKEIEIDKYSKYRLVRFDESKHPDANKEDEDFMWYDPNADTTYFVLTINNTLYIQF